LLSSGYPSCLNFPRHAAHPRQAGTKADIDVVTHILHHGYSQELTTVRSVLRTPTLSTGIVKKMLIYMHVEAKVISDDTALNHC